MAQYKTRQLTRPVLKVGNEVRVIATGEESRIKSYKHFCGGTLLTLRSGSVAEYHTEVRWTRKSEVETLKFKTAKLR